MLYWIYHLLPFEIDVVLPRLVFKKDPQTYRQTYTPYSYTNVTNSVFTSALIFDASCEKSSYPPFQSNMYWTFTGAGSFIHPIAMSVIVPLWFGAAVLGLMARRSRLSPAQGEETPLLERDVTTTSRKKRWHYKLASTLLSLTVFFTMVAMFNTYKRSGRLFPGPHLYGAFWFLFVASVNVALVPWFTQTNVVRNVHALLGLCGMLLLINQFWSGIPILKGVWKAVSSR